MRMPSLIALLAFPILAVAQTTSAQGTQSQASSGVAGTQSAGSSANQTANVILSTSFTTGVTLGSGRVESTFTSSVVFTITQQPTQTQSSGNSTNTSAGSNSSSSSTSTGPLPTAPTDIDGGGGGPGAAPFPGQSTAGGAFGPPDNYISWADAIPVNTLLSLVAGVGIGGALVLA